ncbi:hypothetical protein Neosp_001291 [[Neocosmospora] mangrovei]
MTRFRHDAMSESYAGFNRLRLFRKNYLESHPGQFKKVTGQPYRCEASSAKLVKDPIPAPVKQVAEFIPLYLLRLTDIRK